MYWKWFNDNSFTLSLGLIMMLANPSVTVLGIYAYNQLYWTFFYMQNGFAIKSLNGKKCANKNTDLICIDNDKWILIHPRFPLTLIKKCLCAYNCLTFTTIFIWLLATVFFFLFSSFSPCSLPFITVSIVGVSTIAEHRYHHMRIWTESNICIP